MIYDLEEIQCNFQGGSWQVAWANTLNYAKLYLKQFHFLNVNEAINPSMEHISVFFWPLLIRATFA